MTGRVPGLVLTNNRQLSGPSVASDWRELADLLVDDVSGGELPVARRRVDAPENAFSLMTLAACVSEVLRNGRLLPGIAGEGGDWNHNCNQLDTPTAVNLSSQFLKSWPPKPRLSAC